MTPILDTVPIRVPPLPGEAIDSWLEAYARRLQCKVGELMALAGLAAPTGAAWASRPWTALSQPEDFAALSRLTGVPVAELDAMTLSRFHGTLMTLAPTARRHGPVRWWPHLTGSRFCPLCLHQSAGRWKLVWRLPWTFACVEHRRLLADTCDRCSRRPRSNWNGQKVSASQPGQCRAPLRADQLPVIDQAGAPAGDMGICGRSLAETAALVLPSDGLVLAAARYLDDLLPGTATARAGADLVVELDNLHAIARSCLSALERSTSSDLPDLVCEVLIELGTDSGGLLNSSRSRLGPRDYNAPTMAFAIAVAVAARAVEPEHLDPQIMNWLARHEIRDSKAASPMVKRWTNAEAGLQQTMLRAIGPRLRIVDRLRFQTDGPTPQPPAERAHLRRAMQVPSLFWPGWALRLNTGVHQGQGLAFRAELSIALVLVGNDASLQEAHTALGGYGATSSKGNRSLAWLTQDLRTENSRRGFLAALCHLGAGLDSDGCPIDYARRRELFATVDLDLDLLRDHFDHAGLRLPSPGMLRHYQLRVVELLTGHHPQYPTTSTHAPLDHRQARTYEEATLRNTGAVSAHLEDQAQRILHTAGISEPVSWEPPFAWAPGVDWPGPHPDELDVATLWELLRAGQKPSDVARALGTSPEHIWVAALRHPEAAGPGPSPRGGNVKIPRSRLPDAAQIQRGREQGLCLSELAVRFNCSYTTIKRLASAYGIAFPAGGQRAFVIEPAWLRDQLGPQQRTLKEISEELGIASAHLADLARELDIEIRARGSENCRHPLTPYGGPLAFPPDVWAAFQGTHGIRRIHRFLTATQQATLRQAAAEIGISSANVHALLNVLERRTGVQLLERNGKRRTMTLTPAGQAFAANVREVLELLSHPPHVEPRGSEPIQWLRGGPRRDRQPKDPSPKSQPNAQLPQHSTQESVLK